MFGEHAGLFLAAGGSEPGNVDQLCLQHFLGRIILHKRDQLQMLELDRIGKELAEAFLNSPDVFKRIALEVHSHPERDKVVGFVIGSDIGYQVYLRKDETGESTTSPDPVELLI